MGIWPVIERELRVLARQRQTYWLRVGFAAATVTACFLPLIDAGPGGQTGQVMLMFVGWTSMAFCAFSGCLLTADSISSERREGTLGLLWLTPLRPHQILFGKLLSSSIQNVLSVLAIFPVFFLPVLHGGVTHGEVLRVILCQVVVLFVSMSVGLLVSTAAAEAKNAAIGAVVVMICLFGLPALMLALLIAVYDNTATGPPSMVGFIVAGPAFLIVFSMDRSVGMNSLAPYWLGIAIQIALGTAVLFWALKRFRSIWTHREALELKRENQPARIGRTRSRTPSRSPSRRRRRRRGPAAHSPAPDAGALAGFQNPFEWLAIRQAGDSLPLRLFTRILLAAFVIGVLMTFIGRNNQSEIGFAIAWIAATVLDLTYKFYAATEAPRQLIQDRRSGALELLLTTPIQNRTLLNGLAAAHRSLFRSMTRTLIVLNVVLLLIVLTEPGNINFSSREKPIFFCFYTGAMAAAYCDFRTLSSLGAWFGLVRKTQLRATLDSFGLVLIAPWIVFVLMMFMLASANADEDVLGPAFLMWYGSRCLLAIFSHRLIAAKNPGPVRDWIQENG